MPLRVLSLDGGGTRGLMILVILQELMDLIRRASGLPFTPKPCDYFDLICGSSTGGLIAILLGRLQMDVETAKDTYLDMARGVFGKE
ncbi:FabD/lysophospholipase-like protein, partial [Atractiella rhizophila]